ncbi:hypothetical protein CTheo_7738 [Ceratobasidium theobromae]|uniref:Uncharacterized protein n=1 Tax=Ceratobasidium theobromae TaxID=1582974 RepID=A0A5N5QBM5_9AGAM|nr:hypothetical protein CTheo_7738 [Ceratobasidium theobromae]
MVTVYVVSGASYGIGLELTRRLSSDTKNLVFALVTSVTAAEPLSTLTQSRENLRVYFETEGDRQRGFEGFHFKMIARDIGKSAEGVDVLINNISCAAGGAGGCDILSSEYRHTQIDDSHRLPSGCAFDADNVTRAFIPLLHRGLLKKVVTIASGQAHDLQLNSALPSNLEGSVPSNATKPTLRLTGARYSTLSELVREGFICVTMDCDIGGVSEIQNGSYRDNVLPYFVENVLTAIAHLKPEDSGRCIRVEHERDLITL